MPVKKYRVDKRPGDVGWHSEKQKLEALSLYLTLGNMTLVQEKLNIPISTLWKWKYSPWWKEQIAELEQGNRIKLGTKVSNILSKASIDLEDRLSNGKFVFNKTTNELERRPLETREVVEIMRVGVATQEMIDKAQEAYENRDQREKKAQEQLDKLEKIAKMLGANLEPPKVIDVVPIKEEDKNAEQPQL